MVSVAKAAREFAAYKDAPRELPAAPLRTDWLRPPGAVDEVTFLEQCTRCSDCMKACPPGAIVSDVANGSPIIFSDQVACELCDDFPCIAACATEALLPVTDCLDVRMGVATVSHRVCTAGQRLSCLRVEVPRRGAVDGFQRLAFGGGSRPLCRMWNV